MESKTVIKMQKTGTTVIRIVNGGVEQAILEEVDKDNLLSEKDKQRLEYLKSLPQNRIETINHGK